MLHVEHTDRYGDRLITTEPIPAGQVITSFADAPRVAQPSRLSVQIGPDTHIEELGIFNYLNHSCAPSTIIDTERLSLIAAREIAAGEELTFFYPSTEWDMAQPFACLCGATECLGSVNGAKHLPESVLQRTFINKHIKTLRAQTLSTATA